MTGVRSLGRLVAAAVLLATGIYVFVYLYRWEWNRALFAGLLFLATEVGLALSIVLERLNGLERRVGQPGQAPPPPEVLARIRESAPPPADPFRWLKSGDGSAHVFVPILLGAGVVASALAWVIERVARFTARPAMEEGLAGRLAPLSWPDTPLVEPAADPLRWLEGPGRP
jgi:hypothetical protein